MAGGADGCGAAGAGVDRAGFGVGCAGADCVTGVVFLARSNTLEPVPAFFVARTASVMDVTMKIAVATAVALDNSVAEPRGPNAVCEPMPPNAPARSAACPLCSRTTTTKKTLTIT